jgi:peptidyl-tRNA hydrolase
MTTKPAPVNADNLYLYVLVRTDLPSLGKGKACAHAAHAANLFSYNSFIQPLRKGKDVDPTVEAWHEAAKGFGTTIALDVKDGDTMRAVVDAARGLHFHADVVTDPTYPYEVDYEIYPLIDPAVHTLPAINTRAGKVCFRKEDSCAYVFGNKADLTVLLARFGLLAND